MREISPALFSVPLARGMQELGLKNIILDYIEYILYRSAPMRDTEAENTHFIISLVRLVTPQLFARNATIKYVYV